MPEGHTPSCFRMPFVGLKIPVVPEDELKRNPPSNLDVFFSSNSHEGYAVLRSSVIDALSKAGQTVAADFWSMGVGRYIIFDRTVCKVADGV
jgi:hypothetical protein